jgi:hypothetical protein
LLLHIIPIGPCVRDLRSFPSAVPFGLLFFLPLHPKLLHLIAYFHHYIAFFQRLIKDLPRRFPAICYIFLIRN